MKYTCRLSLAAIMCAVIVGIIPLLFLPRLPSLYFCIALLLLVLLLWVSHFSFAQWLAVVLIVLLWSISQAYREVDDINHYSMGKLTVTGTINSANVNQSEYKRAIMTVNTVNDQALYFYQKFKLVIFLPEEHSSVYAGQQWRFTVAIRPVHSRLNEGGFDRQRFAMANRLMLEARVQQSQLLDDFSNWRQQMIDRSLSIIDNFPYVDILLALAFGERGRMPPQHKQLLITTGTAHLMAISGMHITLAYLFGCFLARGIQFLFPISWINPYFPLWCGGGLATLYVWLSGANPPALRAILAIFIWFFLRLQYSQWHIWQRWLCIVAILLLIDPLMVLSDSFWLSCIAVAALIFIFQWMPLPNTINVWWIKYVITVFYLQLAILFLLAPLQILLFRGISLGSLLTNLMAIPIISFITVPLIFIALLSSFAPAISYFFWLLAEYSIEGMFFGLAFFQHSWIAINHQQLLLSFMGWLGVMIWACRFYRHFWLTGIIILALCLLPKRKVSNSDWQVDMLDVGHGLSIVIHKNQRAILYDTAMAWGDYSMAERVIMPFLQWHNLTLDGIIISHQHNDHIGGLLYLQKNYPNSWLKSSTKTIGDSCKQGDKWQWQDISFEVLWPKAEAKSAQNSDSCVVRVSNNGVSVLLTGDLERQQEAELVSQFRGQLQSTILQVPHHGSNTSSSDLFLRTLGANVALSSNGRYSPWRLPTDNVRQRYFQHNIDWYTTAKSGQLSLYFFEQTYQIQEYRQDHRRWYNQWFGEIPDRFN